MSTNACVLIDGSQQRRRSPITGIVRKCQSCLFGLGRILSRFSGLEAADTGEQIVGPHVHHYLRRELNKAKESVAGLQIECACKIYQVAQIHAFCSDRAGSLPGETALLRRFGRIGDNENRSIGCRRFR